MGFNCTSHREICLFSFEGKIIKLCVGTKWLLIVRRIWDTQCRLICEQNVDILIIEFMVDIVNITH